MNLIFGGGCLILGVLSFLMSFYVAEKVSNTVISKTLQYLGITLFFIGTAMFWMISSEIVFLLRIGK